MEVVLTWKSGDTRAEDNRVFIGYDETFNEFFISNSNFLFTSADGKLSCPGRFGTGYTVAKWAYLDNFNGSYGKIKRENKDFGYLYEN